MPQHPTVAGLLEEAKKRTGLSEFSNDSWREGLEILLRDHAQIDMINDVGRAWIDNILINALCTRLRVDDYHRRNPELAAMPVKRPVFILGVPRTGTTLLSYLMDSDPARRSLLKWEAYNIVPPAAPGQYRTDPRCLTELEKDEEELRNNPGLAARHFEAANGPTEDVHLMAQDFRSLMLDVISNTNVYRDWILFNDATPAFEHRKRVYQILQQTNPGNWTLKMPSDSLFVRHLFKVFPDAKVIWTHRDPITCVCSVFSLRAHSRGAFNRDADIAYMRETFPRQLAFHASRPLEMSQERPNDFYHCYYDSMMADPMAEMRKIYAWLGDEFTPEAEAGMQAWLAANPQGRFGKHEYSLEKWGLDRRDLEPYFADYLKVHPVMEKALA
jgi:hypothetical protein